MVFIFPFIWFLLLLRNIVTWCAAAGSTSFLSLPFTNAGPQFESHLRSPKPCKWIAVQAWFLVFPKSFVLFLLPHLKLKTSSSSTYSLDIFWPIYCYYSACNALFMVAWFHNGSTTFHPGQNLHVKYKKKIAANILESCVHKFYRKFQASNLAVSKHLIGIKANINTCF